MNSLILVDENIPGAEACFQQFGEVRLFAGRELTADDIDGADALIVRSVTRVNADLLAGSKVKFVGSTTIGTDHLDIPWLESQGITWCNAPASNAESVVDYCLSAICCLEGVLDNLLQGGCVGIVGFGNVGSRLFRRLNNLGIRCLAYDPFLGNDQCPVQSPLDTVLKCDLVSLHTPLTHEGPHATYHMLGERALQQLPKQAVLLNAGRGEVLATDVLKTLKRDRPDLRYVLDVWEGEPDIDPELVTMTALATPHIAGYSSDGKIRGLQMVAARFASFMGTALRDFEKPAALKDAPVLSVDGDGDQESVEWLRSVVQACYDVRDDDRALRRAMSSSAPGKGFDRLRKHYPVRRELSAFKVPSTLQLTASQLDLLKALGVGE